MAKNRTKTEKREAARKTLKKLQAKLDKSEMLTAEDIETQYAALALQADANVKTMTVDDAVRWAEAFVREHPEAEACKWAWRMVGHVEAFSSAPRGPKPESGQIDVSDADLRIVKSSLRHLRLLPDRLKKQELDDLQKQVNSMCDGQLRPHMERSALRLALKEIASKKGS